MVDVPAIAPEIEPRRQFSDHEPVQEVAHAGAVCEAGERHVLAAQTEAAVEGDGHQKARLPLAEPEQREGAHAVVEGHDSRVRWRGSNGVPPARALPPPTR